MFVPFRNSLFKIIAVVSFIFLHTVFALILHLGVFPFLSVTYWLPIIPSLSLGLGTKTDNKPRKRRFKD
jgi:hypothetical protein